MCVERGKTSRLVGLRARLEGVADAAAGPLLQLPQVILARFTRRWLRLERPSERERVKLERPMAAQLVPFKSLFSSPALLAVLG